MAALASWIGWGFTILAWMGSAESTPCPTGATVVEVAPRRRPRVRPPPPVRPPADPSQPLQTDVRTQIEREVRAEFAQASSQRRQRRSEERLGRALDVVADFADAYNLDAQTHADLTDAMAALHDELEAQRPPGPPGPDGPSPEAMEAIRTAFDAFRGEVDELLEPELADAFTQHLTPRPLREASRDW